MDSSLPQCGFFSSSRRPCPIPALQALVLWKSSQLVASVAKRPTLQPWSDLTAQATVEVHCENYSSLLENKNSPPSQRIFSKAWVLCLGKTDFSLTYFFLSDSAIPSFIHSCYRCFLSACHVPSAGVATEDPGMSKANCVSKHPYVPSTSFIIMSHPELSTGVVKDVD